MKLLQMTRAVERDWEAMRDVSTRWSALDVEDVRARAERLHGGTGQALRSAFKFTLASWVAALGVTALVKTLIASYGAPAAWMLLSDAVAAVTCAAMLRLIYVIVVGAVARDVAWRVQEALAMVDRVNALDPQSARPASRVAAFAPTPEICPAPPRPSVG